jgi:hypothetical protein
MAIVTSYDWESDSWTHHNGENPTRQIWRDAVAEIAEKAKATLPECNGRVDSAVKIVLAGDVELLPDGKAKVASQSHGTTLYHIVNGECSCKDYAKAPSHWCKHRIAAGLAKRASALTKQRLEQLDAASNGTTTPTPEQATTEAPVAVPPQEPVAPPATPALPEAPASCNVYLNIGGRNVQVTLRDSDEQHLLARLETLLQQFPVVEEPKEHAQQEGWCAEHNAKMKLNHGKRGSWWSHKLPNGQWCNKR